MMNRREIGLTSTFDIYVGNVPKNIYEDDLKQLFYKYGEVKQVLCRWKEEYFGYGIVKFAYKQDADRVLRETNEVTLNGHTMPVKTARRSDQNPQNETSMYESKPNHYVDTNKNQMTMKSKFSNTDYGYFKSPSYSYMEESNHLRKMEVICTTVVDAITFYGCPVSRSEEFIFVTNALVNLQRNVARFVQKPISSKIYAALFSEDNTWYRCSILQPSIPNRPGMCSVNYVDYGNNEIINYKDIVEIPDTLQNVPAFATKFQFANMVCEKSANKMSVLNQLVNKRLVVCAYPTLSPILEFSVMKCYFNGNDIIRETVHKKYAMFSKNGSSHQESPSYECNSKSKAYISGSEIRLNNTPDFRPLPPPPLSKAAQEAFNSFAAKKSRKKGTKVKENSQKDDTVLCNGSHPENKKEGDFHPTMIMKRGSVLSDLIGQTKLPNATSTAKAPKENMVTTPVGKPQQPSIALIDVIIPNLKLINNIRGLVSQSSDDSIIQSAVDLLRTDIRSTDVTDEAGQILTKAQQEYNASLKAIASCTDQQNLKDLLLKRDTCRNVLGEKLLEYLSFPVKAIFELKDKIQKTIMDLESNSNFWMNVQLNNKPISVEDFIIEYNKVKDERWNLVSRTRKQTNESHKRIMDLLATLQNEFYLNTLDGTESDSKSHSCTHSIDKHPAFADKFLESLKDFDVSANEEIKTLTLNKDADRVSVTQWLLETLDVHKEKIEALCELHDKRRAQYDEFSKLHDVDGTIQEFTVNTEEVSKLSDQLSSESANEGTVEFQSNLRKQLHLAMLRKDFLKGILAKCAETHFPELNINLPELELKKYSSTKQLLKDWKSDFFLNLGSSNPKGEHSYVSQLVDEAIFIKEYSFCSPEEANNFIKKAVQWNEIKNESLIKIKGLFRKDSKTVCAILPAYSNTLLKSSNIPSPFEGEKSCHILRDVLTGLRDIHAQKLVLQSVHPLVVLMENDKPLLDFCFDSNYLHGNTSLKGINFTPPDNRAYQSADMYGFGCLVLWLLFPNLSFTPTASGVPNIAAFRSIIEGLILPQDYAFLSALVESKADRRPSSSTLLNKGFLSKYEAYCRSKCNSPKNV